MTFRNLKVFHYTYRYLTLTKASKKLGIAQPSASLAIKDLEHKYNKLLFIRDGKKLIPTKSADQLYDLTTHLFKTHDEMINSMLNQESDQIINIGSSPTMTSHFLPLVTNIYSRKKHHNIIKIIEDTNENLILRLLNQEIDLAFVDYLTPLTHGEINYDVYFTDKIRAVFYINHPLSKKREIKLHDLIGENLLVRNPNTGDRECIEDEFRNHNLALAPKFESDFGVFLINSCVLEHGVAVLPESITQKYATTAGVKTATISDFYRTRNFAILSLKSKSLSNEISLYKEIAKKTITNILNLKSSM